MRKPIKTSDGIIIENIPDNVSTNILKDMVNSLRSSSGSGTYDFQQAMETQARSNETWTPTSIAGDAEVRGAERLGMTPTMAIDEQGRAYSDVAQGEVRQAPTEGMTDVLAENLQARLEGRPTTSASGLVGAAIREAGPTVGAGLGGAAVTTAMGLGPGPGAATGIVAERVTNAVTPYISKFLNNMFGMDVKDATQAWNAFMDQAGVEAPDTPEEELVAAGTRGAVDAAGFLSGGQLMQAGAPLLGRGNLIQEVGKVLTADPTKQLVGETVSGVGAEKAMQIAESREMGPIKTMLMTMGGAVLGDITGSQLVNAAEGVQKLVTSGTMDLPQAVQEVLRLAKERGVDVLTSDFDPVTAGGKRRRSWRESVWLGTGDLQDVQNTQRQGMIRDVMADSGVLEGDYYAKDIMDDFTTKRLEELTALTGDKKEVISRLSDAATPVNTERTRAVIQDEIEALEAISATGYRPLTQQMTQWITDLENKPLDSIEGLRDLFGSQLTSQELSTFSSKGNTALSTIYKSLKEDMGEFIKEAGSIEDFNKWSVANTKLSGMADDYKIGYLNKVLNSTPMARADIDNLLREGVIDSTEAARLSSGSQGDPSAIGELLFSSDRTTVQNIYSRLSPQGQARARQAVLAKVAEDSTDLDTLSPNAFARRLQKMSAQRGVMFSAEDTEQVEGLLAVLKQTKRAEPSGRVLDIAEEGVGQGISGGRHAATKGILKTPLMALGVVLGSSLGGGLVAKAYEQPAMRNLLINYARLTEPQKAGEAGATLIKHMREVLSRYQDTNERAERGNIIE